MPAYLNEFVFRFNRRNSRSRGMLFYRVMELAAGHEPIRYADILAGRKPRGKAPATRGSGSPPSLGNWIGLPELVIPGARSVAVGGQVFSCQADSGIQGSPWAAWVRASRAPMPWRAAVAT